MKTGDLVRINLNRPYLGLIGLIVSRSRHYDAYHVLVESGNVFAVNRMYLVGINED